MNIRAFYRGCFNIISFIFFALLWSVPESQGKDRFQEVGDIKIHYIEEGSGDSSLVLLADWTIPADIWREQIMYFASRGFRVLAVDPRSHNLTTKSETGNTCQQQAADLHALLKILKLEHSYMIAWGAGATTLLEYLSSPETLKPEKIVFVNCLPSYAQADDYPGAPALMQQARKLILSLQDDRAKTTEQHIRNLFKTSQTAYTIKSLTDASLKVPLSAAVSLYFDLFTGDRRPALFHITVPSLIITTTENRSVGEYLQRKIPRSELTVFEDAGPAMFFEKPQAFNQRVESFFGAH